MKETLEIVKKIGEELEKQKSQVEEEVLKEFPEIFAYDILTHAVYYVNHRIDPLWDSSGILLRDHKKGKYNIDDYELVEEFLDEHTGDSEATYISGYGLHHITFRDNYREWILEKLWKEYFSYLENNYISEIKSIGENTFDDGYERDLVDTMIDLSYEFDEFLVEDYERIENLLNEIGNLNAKQTYITGEAKAKKRLEEEWVKLEKLSKQKELEKESFLELWNTLQEKYKLEYERNIPNRIAMSEYVEFNDFLDKMKVTDNGKRLIAMYAPVSFSIKVARLLGKVE